MSKVIKSFVSGRIRDQLGNADLARVSTAAFGIVHTLQDREGLLPGECLAAIVAAYILALEASGLCAGDVLGMVRNILSHGDGRRAEFKAIAEFLCQEVF